jgi:hypothetical protein
LRTAALAEISLRLTGPYEKIEGYIPSGCAVGILFISHSSRNNDRAIKVRDWLREQGWRDTFLDLDPEHDLAPGQRWQEELKKAGEPGSYGPTRGSRSVRSGRP